MKKITKLSISLKNLNFTSYLSFTEEICFLFFVRKNKLLEAYKNEPVYSIKRMRFLIYK